MDPAFAQFVETLHPSVERLMQMAPAKMSALSGKTPDKCIYLLSEGNRLHGRCVKESASMHPEAIRRRRLKLLSELHVEIADWMSDRKAVPKIIASLNPCARLAIVGEAIGPKTVRLSGVNYFCANGKLGATGRYLEEMMRSVGFTLYPIHPVYLAGGTSLDSAPSGQLETAYCTDLCPEFPGRRRRLKGTKTSTSVLKPSPKRIEDALKHGFLERELAVVKPKIILLLGSRAYSSFYSYFLGRITVPSLNAAMEDLASNAARYKGAVVVPFLHPSPASPSFQRWYRVFRRAPMRSQFVQFILRCLES
jgi:uracil-DNA glycosylase